MTRNTLTKARIVLVDTKTKTFGTNSKITSKEATQGIDYIITYSYAHLFVQPDAHHPFLGDECEFSSSDCRCTHYSSYEEARKIIIENKKMLKAKGKAYTSSSYCAAEDAPVGIQATFETYYDTVTKTTVFRKEETKKWGKNLLFIDRRHCSHAPNLKTKSQFFTITEEPESLLIEIFGVKYDDHNVPHIIVSPHNPPFRIYKDGRAYEVAYKENKRAYVDLPNIQLYADDERFRNIYYYYDDSRDWGLTRAIDATSGYCEEERWGHFAASTREMLTKFGVPEFMFGGYYSSPDSVDTLLEMIQAFLKFSVPYHKGETLICQEISTFLNGVPFDEEHAVVKYKNGYILRLGKINQCYKVTETRGYNQQVYTSYRDGPTSQAEATNELVSEQYIEYARLFISNTFTTRSLALSTDGGRRWKHDGIHLVANLFQANPETSHLGIDVEKRNRAALVELYTVHPRLKYMKKYMEKHPDVLYNSCVPFLRALFQYDMILETLIALGKDGVFWKEERNRYHWYGYRSSRQEYKETKEYFYMDDFVECFQLRDLPQRGDFYQRLGMTKQQFKLLFENIEQAMQLFKIIKKVKFVIPPMNGEEHGQIITLDSWNSKTYRSLLKYVSFEDFRLIIEVIKKRLAVSDNEYSIGNEINSLQTYYGSIKRVYKAVCQKTYDLNTLIDYLRMRQQLKQDQFPDFHESIWDLFPDDQEELQRYHDRIMFLSEENAAAKEAYTVIRYDEDIHNFVPSANDLYKLLDNGGVTASAFNDTIKLADEAKKFAEYTISLRDLITSIPTNIEELDALNVKVNEARIKFFNLYSMYWEENSYRSYHGDQQTNSAKRRWGNLRYRDFIIHQLAKDLDLNKYDLYLTLRRKFTENDPSFHADSYPYEITAQEDLDRLYEELAVKEPELNALIAERERQRREAIRREQENKIAEQQKKYVERYKKLKKFNYAGDNERCIVVPQNLVSLIVEGQTLHHCVGSFVDSVSNGDNTIVFLRKKEDVDTPYVTISLLQNDKEWYIDQAHGDHNSDISEEDVAFLKIWAKENNVRQDSVKTRYGMYGHN